MARSMQGGPGARISIATVLKNTSLTERTRLQFRAEFFNMLNHTNFATPNAVVFTLASAAPAPTAG